MSKTTRATQVLARAGITHSVHTYDYDPEATRIGLQAAEAMGVAPGEVFKTLMAAVDGKPVCVLVPSDREVSLKKLAAAFKTKSAAMMRPADAERLTGYHVGGISPLGQKRAVPTVVDAAALGYPEIFVNGGQRGLQLRVKPDDLVRVLQARTEAVT
ncbi:Cys-tRNA(Pro) deacylase [Methylobacterium frigidaeris]|uniref:Cys-tRNA(Pro)/Cys-tRNA(Cys) deacylase n=1 Tax=Methylobacterium frigidaeris TaxID=2038277 RepID=A0AA37M387_9HYPH|nr:Cys-tRNA(Pro) deacylase [Methylobacterium frigidaeris]PIK71126.1 Cys-tRNA(Pro) deacylase [Methylobacterium frigidaeris]GJD61328.1 Cys-tRNA(Pro)/Cys-tRNA(Cys) deacylase YbaK [Methylobacterium frigidaeris]